MVDDEPMNVESVGQRLRGAREAKGMSIEEIAAATRIPTRHLLSLEESEWGRLPAQTYSVGFAKNYAAAVGLDKAEIADQLRAEMGTNLPAHYSTAPADSFEPVDSDRSMPKGIVFGAIAAVVLIALLLSWLSNREYASDGAAPAVEAIDNGVVAADPAAVVQETVVITANEPVWIEVRDGATILKQGELASGQSFEVPASAVRPVLTTAKPEALRISIGTGDAPAVGPVGTRVANVSLLAADLRRGPVAAAPAVATPVTAAPTVRRATPAASPPSAVSTTTDPASATTNAN